MCFSSVDSARCCSPPPGRGATATATATAVREGRIGSDGSAAQWAGRCALAARLWVGSSSHRVCSPSESQSALQRHACNAGAAQQTPSQRTGSSSDHSAMVERAAHSGDRGGSRQQTIAAGGWHCVCVSLRLHSLTGPLLVPFRAALLFQTAIVAIHCIASTPQPPDLAGRLAAALFFPHQAAPFSPSIPPSATPIWMTAGHTCMCV